MTLETLAQKHAVLSEALREVETIKEQRDSYKAELEALHQTVVKAGFHVEYVSDGCWELVKNPETPEPDGDFTRPIPYTDGMKVTKGLFYTDSEDIWEAIKDGTPKNFMDTEYFEVITV